MKTLSPFYLFNLLALALCLILGAGCTKASRARRLLASADLDFQAQKYDRAEIEYESVLHLSRLNEVAVRQLGFLYFEEGNLPKAIAFLKEALKQDPTNAEVQLKIGEIYGNLRDTKDAVALLSSVLQSDPGNEHALELMAQMAPSSDLSGLRQRLETQLREGGQAAACHSALGWIDVRTQKLDDAESEFQKAASLDPKLASAYLGRAALCSLRKDAKGLGEALKTAAELSPVRSTVRLQYAEYKMQTGAEEAGKAMLLDITKKAPDYIPAWVFLMRIAFADHQYDACKADVDIVLARDSSNYDALFESAMLDMALRDAPKALSALQKLTDMFKARPQDAPPVKYNLARAYLMNNQTPAAVATLHEVLASNPDYSPAVLLLADLDNRSQNFIESARLLSRLIKKQPGDMQAQLALAKTYLAQDLPDRALAVYEQMARVLPKNPEIPLRMGIIYYKQGESAKARAALEKSLELAPDYQPALEQITFLDIAEKNYDQALRRTARVIEQNPKAAEPFIFQGDIYQSEGQTNKAESAYSKAIELNPDLPAAYLSLAALYLQSHQEQQALDRLNALVAKHTNDLNTLITIGVIHQGAGHYDLARDAYEKVLAVDSNSFPALNNLAYVDAAYLGKVDEGFQLATRASVLRPYDPHAADTLGWILFKKHEYAEALSSIQDSADKQPGDPEVLMHLGMAHYMMGEEKSARLSLEQALAGHADYPGKALARRCLDVLDIDPAAATPEVVKQLQDMAKADSQDPVVLSRLAAIQELHGHAQEAADSLQKLLSISPQDWSAMIRLSRLYAGQLHDPRKALEFAKKAHSLAPDDGGASALLGELVFESDDYPWALSLLEDASRQSSDQPSLFYHLALAYYAVGRTADADAAMQKAVQQGDSPANLDQAKQFLAMRAAVKDPAQAEASSAQVQKILAQDPNDVPALMVSELLAEHRGAVDEAVRTCQKVLSIYPHFVPATRQLAMLYSRSKNPEDLDKAFDLAQKARASLPDDLELAKTLGLLAYRRADYDASMLLLREYVDKAGDDGEALYYLGMDYSKLNQTNSCKKALERAVALLQPSDPLAGPAKGILKQLK